MQAVVATVEGTFSVDLETEEVEEREDGGAFPPPSRLDTGLPRVVCAARSGATVAAVVAGRPPLLVSHDAGRTWREAGRGLPPGFAVAVSEADPDVILFAARNRLYLSRDGGRFWRALQPELPDIVAVALP